MKPRRGRPHPVDRRVPTSTHEHLSNIIDLSFVAPAINQIELHPLLNQAALRAVNAEHGIVTEAYGPLGVGQLLDNPTIAVDRRGARQDARAGADPVEHPARQRRHPAVVVAGADRGEPRRVRLRADRRRRWPRSTGSTTAPGSGPDPETYTGT